jgi:uncharacterized pyridoxamine 5'-phosphate oxidase family protein
MSTGKIGRVEDEKHIYLTTIGRNTGRAHTVELMFAMAGGKIYLSHEGAYTDWMKNIIKNNLVEYRIRDVHFKGTARIVTGGDEFEIGKNALYIKYYGNASKEIIDDWFSMSTVAEITPQVNV